MTLEEQLHRMEQDLQLRACQHPPKLTTCARYENIPSILKISGSNHQRTARLVHLSQRRASPLAA